MITPLTIAKPGQKITDKHKTFILYMEGPIPTEDDENTIRWESGDKVIHARGADWPPSYLELTLGSETIGNSYLSYKCELASNLVLDFRVTLQAKETVYIWNDISHTDLRGSIDITTNDHFFLADPSSGTFSGNGIVDDQKVKVVGVSSGEIIPPTRYLTRSGTIIGLP